MDQLLHGPLILLYFNVVLVARLSFRSSATRGSSRWSWTFCPGQGASSGFLSWYFLLIVMLAIVSFEWSNSQFWCEFQKSNFIQSKLQLWHIQTCLAEADLQLGLAPDTWNSQCDHPDLADGRGGSGALQREADHGCPGRLHQRHCISSGFAECVSCLNWAEMFGCFTWGVVVINVWDPNAKQFSSLTFTKRSVFKHHGVLI